MVVVIEHIERCSARDVQDRAELNLTLCLEVRVCERVLGVLRNGLVKLIVLVLLDVRRVARPDCLLLIQQGPLVTCFLDLLRGGLFILFLEIKLVVLSALFFFVGLFVGLLVFLLVFLLVLDFDLDFLLIAGPEVDGVVDEFRVLGDDLSAFIRVSTASVSVIGLEAKRQKRNQRGPKLSTHDQHAL